MRANKSKAMPKDSQIPDGQFCDVCLGGFALAVLGSKLGRDSKRMCAVLQQ